jgi:hypothetical protein
MKAKLMAFILIVINLCSLFSELPRFVLVFSLVSLLVSLIPSRFIKTKTVYKVVSLILMILLLKQHFKPFLVTECGVSFFVFLSFLKFIELESADDYFNMLLILVFEEACIFIINPSAFALILGILKIIIFFYFLLKIRNYTFSVLNIRRLLLLAAPSILFSFVLFYTFPRFTQGFMNVQNAMNFSATSHDIDFKDLGPLNLSDKIVFKVFNFPFNKFSNHDIYWRTNVLWDLRKNFWRSNYAPLRTYVVPTVASKKESFNYLIKTNFDYQDFLVHFDSDSSLSLESKQVNYYLDYSFKLVPPTKTSLNLNFTSSYNLEKKVTTPIMLLKAVKLNSPSLELIKRNILKDRKLENMSLDQRVALAITFFKSKKYLYSITPPQYESVEDFILNGSKGYCSHFASAMTFILRTLNIPSRLVLGFQGAEFNPFDSSINIREKDSHAWVEYFNGVSWIRLDPTELVAPERIAMGSSRFFDIILRENENIVASIPRNVFKFPLIAKSLLFIDFLENRFASTLFNFDKDEQQSFFKNKSGLYFVISLILFLGVLGGLLHFLNKEKLSKEEKRYRHFLKKMQSYGFTKIQSETITEFTTRILINRPELNSLVQQELEAYLNYHYRK